MNGKVNNKYVKDDEIHTHIKYLEANQYDVIENVVLN